MDIFEQYEAWLDLNRTRLTEKGFSVAFVQGKRTENTGAYLDITTNTLVARATLWESMEMQLEAIRGDSDSDIIWETHKPNDIRDVFRLLNGFFDRLGMENKT